MPDIPDIYSEVEYLDEDEGVEKLKNLPYDKGLYVVSFNSGHGNYYDFIRRTAPIIAETKPFEHFRGTNGKPTGYPLGSTVSILKSDDTRDIILTPIKRMIEWGDGSVHYSCSHCRKPCKIEDMDLLRGEVYHESCLNMISD